LIFDCRIQSLDGTTKPDVALTMSKMSRHLNKPTELHWKIAEQIFRCLKAIAMQGPFAPRATLELWAGADHGGCLGA